MCRREGLARRQTGGSNDISYRFHQFSIYLEKIFDEVRAARIF
jgi:hypothetical protein